MKGNFARCLKITVDRIEQGFTIDNGGPTMGGVTIPFLTDYWRRIGRKGAPTEADIRRLDRPTIEAAYRMLCWDSCQCDGLPLGLDLVVFDAAVNSYRTTSIMWLQRQVGVKADGVLGPVTMARISQLDRWQLVADLMQRRWRAMRTMSAWKDAAAGWGSRLLLIQSEAQKMIYAG